MPEHEAVLKAIERKNGPRAAQAMRQLVDSAGADMVDVIELR
jgi:DNA-binding GntR family transcriptional regulator